MNPALQRCDNRWYPLRDHPVQRALVEDDVRFKVAVCGRRCLAKGTLVATPTGPVEIEKLRVGDTVIGYGGAAKVTKVWAMGTQEVIPLVIDNKKVVATGNHRFLIDGELVLARNIKTNGGYLADTYDISIDNATNLYYLHNGLVTHNSGKSEKTKRMMVKKAISKPNQKLGIAAPTLQQVRQIFWHDLKLLSYYPALDPGAVRESDMSITYPNGSVIQLIGLDKAERMEGIAWSGLLFDELDSVKNIMQAWGENISPALDTVNPQDPDYRPWAILIGTPDGMELLYDRYEYARTANDPDWASYHWTSEEILPADVIEAAKKRMSATQYAQEYLGSFETATGRIYKDYSDDNLTNEEIGSHEQLMLACDQNYTPMASCICVKRDDKLFVLDEIVLESAVSRQIAEEFCDRYSRHENKNLLLYGDASGKAGEKHAHPSDYTEMEKVFRMNGWQVTRQIKNANPAIKDRQNAVRAMIKNAAGDVRLFVHPHRAEVIHQGLRRCTLKKGSTFLEEDSYFQHSSTALGYLVDRIWPIKPDKKEIKFTPQPTKHHWNDLSR